MSNHVGQRRVQSLVVEVDDGLRLPNRGIVNHVAFSAHVLVLLATSPGTEDAPDAPGAGDEHQPLGH